MDRGSEPFPTIVSVVLISFIIVIVISVLVVYYPKFFSSFSTFGQSKEDTAKNMCLQQCSRLRFASTCEQWKTGYCADSSGKDINSCEPKNWQQGYCLAEFNSIKCKTFGTLCKKEVTGADGKKTACGC